MPPTRRQQAVAIALAADEAAQGMGGYAAVQQVVDVLVKAHEAMDLNAMNAALLRMRNVVETLKREKIPA